MGFTCQPDAIVVGSVGWLTPVKGHRILLEAIGKLKSRFPRLHTMIVGRGDQQEELQALVTRLDLVESVTFLGRTP